MTKNQFDELLFESNDICDFNNLFGYSRVIAHYDKNKGMTTLYCICYEDHGDGYKPKIIEPLVKFKGRRLLTFASMERIEEENHNENFGR